MREVDIEIGDLEYELGVTHFYPGREPRGWDPGAGAEVELDKKVVVWEYDDRGFGKKRGTVSLEEFLDVYAEYREVPRSEALRVLEDYCIEYLIERMKEAYDDHDY